MPTDAAATIIIHAVGSTSPTILLNPNSGKVGDVITLTATNMAASHACSASMDGQDLSLSNSTTNASGSLTATFIVPSLSKGIKTVTLSDGTNNPTAIFNVVEGVTPTSEIPWWLVAVGVAGAGLVGVAVARKKK